MSAWQRLQQLAGIYKVVTLPIALATSAAAGARLYNFWNPDSYACWYLWSISAGHFQEPLYVRPWVNNKHMTNIVKGALEKRPWERMTLISGQQVTGKTSAVLKECHEQKRIGFFVSLGNYKGEKTDRQTIETFVASNLISNHTHVYHSLFQQLKWWCFPQPKPGSVWQALRGAFEKHPQQLVLVVDETQVLANEAVQHSGILNEFCALSAWGPVLLVASEFGVPQFFQVMTHIESRTTQMYSPSASTEEMRPYVKEHFEKDFGAEGVEQIVNSFGGSFMLLDHLNHHRADGITGVHNWHKQKLKTKLQLCEDGMENEQKARSTGQAMIVAAKLTFGVPVEAISKGTLELAQVGAAKIETSNSLLTASCATPLTAEVMKELVCDTTIHAIMKKRVPQELYQTFQLVIKNKCQTARK
mmetsp:Transcript_78471/g.172008  ORF Transcript_78471/g.172008 Transcript_78471/m.172008 type:complete len:416 (-) Transcript_78471:248-1495(-)